MEAAAGETGRRSVCQQPPESAGAPSATRPGAVARAGACASTAAASPITPHVSGSSKNPAYSSEWTKSATPTAARPMPNARLAARDEHERPPDGDEEPEVEREADDAELREHGQRRRVRRVAPRWSGGPAASALARGCPPMPTPAIGRSSNASSVIRTRRERPLVTSRAERSPMAAPATPAATSVATQRAGEEHDPRAPVAAHDRDRERHHEERDEARLRVRVEEAPEQEHDDAGRDDPVRRSAASHEDRDEQDGDRDHEVAPVQARILEERRDPEERRVRVRDLEVACEEQRARVRLPDPDRGEQRRRVRRA